MVVMVKIVEADVVHAFVIGGCLNFQCRPERGACSAGKQAKILFHFGCDGGKTHERVAQSFPR